MVAEAMACSHLESSIMMRPIIRWVPILQPGNKPAHSGNLLLSEIRIFQFLQPVECCLFTDMKFRFQYFSVNGTVMLQILSYFSFNASSEKG